MQNHGGATRVAKKPKARDVSPRYLSPASITTSSSTDSGSRGSPNSILSPIKQKPKSSAASGKPRTLKNSGFLRGLWPSSSVLSPSNSRSRKSDTLADFISNERCEELEERENRGKSDRSLSILNRQRSCTEFRRFENERNPSSKENYDPIFGGSNRNTSKSKYPLKSKISNLLEEEDILPGRFSIDETTMRKNSFSDHSDGAGKDLPESYMAQTASSRKHRIDVPSRHTQDLPPRSRRWSGDYSDTYSNSNNQRIFSLRKGNRDRASSPARTGSPKAPLGATMMNSKPPTNPSRGKGVGNLLSLGIELLKGKKYYSSPTSPLGPGSTENGHRLKLLHSSLMQWRYINARSEAVDENIIKKADEKCVLVCDALVKLRHSVLQKKLQLQKEKLEMKLDYIVQSQIKALEAWESMEREHSGAVASTTDYLHSVVCKIPLLDGAKVEPKPASVTVHHASDLATEICMMINTSQPTVEKTVGIVAELATLVIQEKQLLEECQDLFKFISSLEIEERSLRSSIMQLTELEQEILA